MFAFKTLLQSVLYSVDLDEIAASSNSLTDNLDIHAELPTM